MAKNDPFQENKAGVNSESVLTGRTLKNNNDFSDVSLDQQNSVGDGTAPKEYKDEKHTKKSLKECPECKGKGLEDENTICSECDGVGKVTV